MLAVIFFKRFGVHAAAYRHRSLICGRLCGSWLSLFAFTDSLLKRTEGALGQSAHFWWDPYCQPLQGGWWVLPVFGRRWGQGLPPAGPPAEEPYQTTPQTRGHRQRWGGGGRRGPADLCSSEQQPQDHLRVSGARRLLKWRRRLSALTVEERVIQQTISEETPELEEWNASSSFDILRITRGFSFLYLPFAVFFLLLFWGGFVSKARSSAWTSVEAQITWSVSDSTGPQRPDKEEEKGDLSLSLLTASSRYNTEKETVQ